MADHQYISVNKWLGITDCQIFKLIFLLQDERLNCPVTTCWYGLWTSVVHRSVRRYSPKSIFCSLNADVLGARAWNVPCGLLLLIGAHCWDFVWQMHSAHPPPVVGNFGWSVGELVLACAERVGRQPWILLGSRWRELIWSSVGSCVRSREWPPCAESQPLSPPLPPTPWPWRQQSPRWHHHSAGWPHHLSSAPPQTNVSLCWNTTRARAWKALTYESLWQRESRWPFWETGNGPLDSYRCIGRTPTLPAVCQGKASDI